MSMLLDSNVLYVQIICLAIQGLVESEISCDDGNLHGALTDGGAILIDFALNLKVTLRIRVAGWVVDRIAYDIDEVGGEPNR